MLVIRFIVSFIVAVFAVMAVNVIFMAGAFSGFTLPVALVASIVYTWSTWTPETDEEE